MRNNFSFHRNEWSKYNCQRIEYIMCVLVDFPSTLAENLMLQPLRLKLWNLDLFDAVNWQFCITTCKLKGRKDHGKVCSFVGKVTFSLNNRCLPHSNITILSNNILVLKVSVDICLWRESFMVAKNEFSISQISLPWIYQSQSHILRVYVQLEQ